MRDGLRGLDGGEWFLVALGWGAGLAWALVSIGVGIQWWYAAAILVLQRRFAAAMPFGV